MKKGFQGSAATLRCAFCNAPWPDTGIWLPKVGAMSIVNTRLRTNMIDALWSRHPTWEMLIRNGDVGSNGDKTWCKEGKCTNEVYTDAGEALSGSRIYREVNITRALSVHDTSWRRWLIPAAFRPIHYFGRGLCLVLDLVFGMLLPWKWVGLCISQGFSQNVVCGIMLPIWKTYANSFQDSITRFTVWLLYTFTRNLSQRLVNVSHDFSKSYTFIHQLTFCSSLLSV